MATRDRVKAERGDYLPNVHYGGRVFTQRQLQAVQLWNVTLPTLLEEGGFTLDGISYRQDRWMPLLVVKATTKAGHWVTFVSGQDLWNCIEILVGKMQAGSIEWSLDKYR